MAISTGRAEGEPMMEMNTTPLIDVMLVLLVMFIITIPIQTHAVKLDLPANNQNTPPPPIKPDVNTLGIAPNDAILWNGQSIDEGTLRIYLSRTAEMAPTPELHIQPDAYARYTIVDQVLADVKKAKVTKVGFVGNERYAIFDK